MTLPCHLCYNWNWEEIASLRLPLVGCVFCTSSPRLATKDKHLKLVIRLRLDKTFKLGRFEGYDCYHRLGVLTPHTKRKRDRLPVWSKGGRLAEDKENIELGFRQMNRGVEERRVED